MFWEFLKFWGGCIVTGWHIGDGIFSAVVEFCLLTSAGLFFLKFVFKQFNWKRLWKKWEEIVMKWAFILFLGSFLIAAVFVAPFLEYKKASTIAEIPPTPKAIAKPLPVKIIPRPEPPPIISTQQLAVVETQKSFETFNVSTGDVEDAAGRIARLNAEDAAKTEAETEAENRHKNFETKKWWDIYLPYYQRSIVALRDVLANEAAKSGDGIAEPADYFQCLPPTMGLKTEEMKVTEIRLQKNTNMDFVVIITGLDGLAYHRQLKISCSAGYLEMEPEWGDKLRRNIHINNPAFDYHTKEIPVDKANDLILEAINDLVAIQKKFLSNTNKQNLNIPENK